MLQALQGEYNEKFNVAFKGLLTHIEDSNGLPELDEDLDLGLSKVNKIIPDTWTNISLVQQKAAQALVE